MHGTVLRDIRIWPLRAAQSLVSLLLLLATAALVGRVIGLPQWASLGVGHIPMAPITSICFIALGTALLVATRPVARPAPRFLAALGAILVVGCGLVVWLGLFDAESPDRAAVQAAGTADFYVNPFTLMSPVTAALFVLAGAASAGMLAADGGRANARPWLLLASASGVLVAAAATLIVLSYAVGAPLFYDSETLPMALPTAISFVLLGSALISMVVLSVPGQGRSPWRLADVPVAAQLRVGLSGIVLAVVGLGYLVHLQSDVLWAQTQRLYDHSLVVTRTTGDLNVYAWKTHGILRDLESASAGGDVDRLAREIKQSNSAVASAIPTLTRAYLGPPADIEALDVALDRSRSISSQLLQPGSVDNVARARLIAEGTASALDVLARTQVIADFAKGKAEQLYAEAERRNGALEAAVVTMFAAVLLAATFVGWLLNRQISRRVRELTTVAAQLGRGQLDVRSGSGSANELGVLADTLNSMADTIQDHLQSKEQLTQQLRRSEASLAAQNKELESFSYSVSHDLRAPLRSIDGFSRILLEDYAASLDPEAHDFLKRMRAAAQYMAQLIDDLLRLSRLSRGELRYERVDLSTLIREIAAELVEQDPGRQLTLLVADGAVVEGDRPLLRIALSNLLGNAWKFTSRRTDARIEFGTATENGHLHYFVRDNGVGFDPAYADKLFGAFQRLHSKDEFPGTGIGLATVQRVIRRHGGRVWAESAINEGATFRFELDSTTTQA